MRARVLCLTGIVAAVVASATPAASATPGGAATRMGGSETSATASTSSVCQGWYYIANETGALHTGPSFGSSVTYSLQSHRKYALIITGSNGPWRAGSLYYYDTQPADWIAWGWLNVDLVHMECRG